MCKCAQAKAPTSGMRMIDVPRNSPRAAPPLYLRGLSSAEPLPAPPPGRGHTRGAPRRALRAARLRAGAGRWLQTPDRGRPWVHCFA